MDLLCTHEVKLIIKLHLLNRRLCWHTSFADSFLRISYHNVTVLMDKFGYI